MSPAMGINGWWVSFLVVEHRRGFHGLLAVRRPSPPFPVGSDRSLFTLPLEEFTNTRALSAFFAQL